jgi:DNA repair exonuclease SbcCD ATPase subunit
MAISLLKRPAAAVSPQRAKLDANQKAISDARAKMAPINEKLRAAQADITTAEESEHRLAALRDEMDRARADALYAGDVPPDLTRQEKQFAVAEQQHKRLLTAARTSAHLRTKYSADIAAIQEEIRAHSKETTQLTWEAAKEELAALADEYREAEAQFLDVARRAFAAARAADKIAMANSYNPFCGSGNVGLLRLVRPEHPAYVDPALTAEQAQAKRIAFFVSIDEAAETLVARLLTHTQVEG